MLYVKSMEFENFMRFKKAKIEFPESGIFGILAQGAINKRRSNFLGKSTITKGIRYNLTGMYDGDKETDLIHTDEKIMKTKLVLSDGIKDYTITRGRDYKNNALVELDWIDKTTEAKKAISDLIGLEKDDFDLTSFFKQEEINSFMLLSNTEKKKRVMKWQKNDHWSDKEKKVLEDIKEQNDEISKIKFQISNNKLGLSGANSVEEMQVELDESKEKYTNLKQKYLKYKEKQEELSKIILTKKERYNSLTKDINNKQIRVKNLSTEISTLKQGIERIGKEDEIKQNIENVSSEIKTIDIQELNNKRAELKHNIMDLTNKVEKFKKYNHGMCPIINESCDRLKFSPKQEKQLLDEIDYNKESLSHTSESISKYNRLIEQLDLLKNNLNRINLYKSKLSPLMNQYKELKSELASNEKELEKLSEIDTTEYDSVNAKFSALQDLVKEESSKIKVIEYRIKQAEEKLSQNIELEEKLLTELNILDNRKYLAYMFGKNGIPSLEIENSFQVVEDEINVILKELDNSLGVIFKPYRELSSFETHCISCGWAFPKGYRKKECEQCNEERRKKRSDEIILNVMENGVERPFSVCSGGLKTLVSTAIRTALAMLLKRNGNCQLNVLFLDEIDSALDKEFKDKIKDLVVRVLHKKLGFNQIFWISHDPDITRQIPKVLMVKGYKDYSNVDWL